MYFTFLNWIEFNYIIVLNNTTKTMLYFLKEKIYKFNDIVHWALQPYDFIVIGKTSYTITTQKFYPIHMLVSYARREKPSSCVFTERYVLMPCLPMYLKFLGESRVSALISLSPCLNILISLFDWLLEKQIVQQMPWPSGHWKIMYFVILI